MKKLKIHLGLLSIIVIGVISYKYYFLNYSDNKDLKEVTMQGDFVMDVNKKEEIVGSSENVFVAKVIKQVGVDTQLPSTQFEVEVLKNIKGELEKEVIVNQLAGIYENEGEKYLLTYEGQELLEAGKTYLFATLYDSNQGWHNPHPAYGEILIENEENLENVETEYTKAFENQKISSILNKNPELELEDGLVQE
ncbi:hypothetical protein AB1L07_12030 [Niallia alba]|uniref:hypothetical protein n=1 Tax=Niallia alba TaxID=2729105 RepID=UPI00039FB84B